MWHEEGPFLRYRFYWKLFHFIRGPTGHYYGVKRAFSFVKITQGKNLRYLGLFYK